MNTILIVALVAVALLLLAKGKRKSKASTKGKTGWFINHSPGMPDRPVVSGGGWHFDFPTTPDKHVHYVQNYSPPRLTPGKRLVVKFRVDGEGFVPQEFPDRPALVTLLIQRRGDNMGAQGEYASYRWFSRTSIPLTEGDHEFDVPLDVSAWGDVFWGKDARLFAEALRDAESVGLVFGSDGGKGHGVYATGPSRFTLESLAVH